MKKIGWEKNFCLVPNSHDRFIIRSLHQKKCIAREQETSDAKDDKDDKIVKLELHECTNVLKFFLERVSDVS